MRAYRIAGGKHPIFSGEGARRHGGRWNSPGRAVVYASGCFALALLERLVHTAIGRLPQGDRWIAIDLPDDLIEPLDEGALRGWDAPESRPARSFGDRWLDEFRAPALAVPSVVTRIDRNLVINPHHPDAARLRVSEERAVAWDPRLLARFA